MDEKKELVPSTDKPSVENEATTECEKSPEKSEPKEEKTDNINSAGIKTKGKSKLNIDTKTKTLAFKCYEEQLPNGYKDLCEKVRAFDKSKLEIIIIKHDRDIVADGFWKSAKEKPHIHGIIRAKDNLPRRVSNILSLLGITFREGKDDSLISNKGLEKVGNFATYTVYLMHKTTEAINDCKEPYDISELVSNLSNEEIEIIQRGYNSVGKKKEANESEYFSNLGTKAYTLGYNLQDFEPWYFSLPDDVLHNSRMKQVRERYDYGIAQRMELREHINRVCIYIQGESNRGKSYACRAALTGIGIKNIYIVDGGGTGKFDSLKTTDEAILIDDDICPNLLNMSGDYCCRVYKRGRNNPTWTGKFLVVTYNKPFKDWCEDCGIKTESSKGWNQESEQYKALKTRFYVFDLKTNKNGVSSLHLVWRTERGTEKDLNSKDRYCGAFKRKFHETIKDYNPTKDKERIYDLELPDLDEEGNLINCDCYDDEDMPLTIDEIHGAVPFD